MGLQHSVAIDASRNLLELEVKNAWLSVDNINPMPLLISLTLEFIRVDDEKLNGLNVHLSLSSFNLFTFLFMYVDYGLGFEFAHNFKLIWLFTFDVRFVKLISIKM